MSTPMTDEEIRQRADELVAQMTVAEKAGQLTQYFYFGFEPPELPGPPTDNPHGRASRPRSRRRSAGGEVGSLLFVTDPAETNRLQRLAIEGNRLGHPGAVRLRRDPRAAHDLPGADRDGGVLGPGDHRARPGGRRPRGAGRRHPLDLRADGRHRPRPALGPDHRGRRARTRTSARRWPPRRSAASRAPRSAPPSASSPGPSTSPATAPPLGGRDYDEVNLSDSELWNVYLPPFQAAVEAGAGNVMTAYMDLNGIPATGNHWLLRRRAARARGASTASSSATPTPCATCYPRLRRDLTDAGARALNVGVDLEMAIVDPAYAHLPEAVASGARPRARTWTRAYGGCSRRSCGWGCSTTRTSTRTGPARCWPTRRTARSRGSPPSGRRCCCATRAALLPLDARVAAVDRRHRTAGRLPARHARAVVLRLRPRRDGHRAGRHPGPASATRSRSTMRRASVRRSASSRRCSTCSAATRRRSRRTSTTTAELARAVDLARERGRRRGRGRRVAEHDRRGGLPLVARAARAVSSSCCRPSSRPARRSCCW